MIYKNIYQKIILCNVKIIILKTIAYLKLKEERLIEKLRILKLTEINSYEFLKQLSKSQKGFEWNKLPPNFSQDSLLSLEKLGFIFTHDFSEYLILSNSNQLSDVIKKVDKA
jgi:hypothetical protein